MKKKVEKRKLFTKIFAYNVRHNGIPIGEDVLLEQISIGHRYQNALVDNERKRRNAIQQVRANFYPELPILQLKIKEEQAKIQLLRDEIKANNAKERKKIKQPDKAAQIKEREKTRNTLQTTERELKKLANANPEVLQAYMQVAVQYSLSKDATGLRDEYAQKGLHSGTYQQIERQIPHSGDAPKFKSWTGEGKVRIYLGQKGDMEFTNSEGKVFRGGYSADAITLNKCKEIQIHTKECTNKKKTFTWKVTEVILQIKDKPIHIYVKYDRELQGEIREVCLVRKKIATHFRWQIQFTAAKDTPWEKTWPQAQTNFVAINTGYRKTEQGLRVAYWQSDNHSGEITIPNWRIERVKKVEDLQEIRAKNYNFILGTLKQFLNLNEVPDWLKEKTKTIHLWQSQSQARLASIILYWRNSRFPNDDEIYTKCEDWRKQDKHLYEWQEHQRKGESRWRTDFYRKQLQELAMKYGYLILHDEIPKQKNSNPENEPDEVVKRYRNLASNGFFNRLAIETFKNTLRVDGKYTTTTCCKCKQQMDFNKSDLIHCCEHCGTLHDQDRNTAINTLEKGKQLDIKSLIQRKDGSWGEDTK